MSKRSFRYLQASPEALTEGADGARTLAVAFSSETPVLRRDGNGAEFYEVLSHDPQHADLSMLQKGAFLDEHMPHRQIGSIVRAWLDARDRKGRAIVAFANTPLGDERFELMRNGHRRDISFGYETTKLLKTTRSADGKPVRHFAWRAFEISSVSVGADHFAVGVGRNHPIESTTKNRQLMKNTKYDPNEFDRTEMTAVQRSYIHDHPHCEDEIKLLVAEANADDMPIGQFKKRAFEIVTKNQRPRDFRQTSDPGIPNHEIGMSKREIGSYSFVRALRSAIENGGTPKNCFEADVHQQVERSAKERAQGWFVPTDVVLGTSTREFQKRDLYTGDFGSGGALVNPEMPMPVIEILRNRMICARLGARVLGGLSGPVPWPRQTGTATAQALGPVNTN